MTVMIVGTLRIPTENMDAARAALAELISASRQEAGCLDFSFSENIAEPGLLHLIERWADRTALEAHWRSATLQAFRPTAEKLGVNDRSMTLFEIASDTKL
jgi:quinol monooxygenase YgiN